MKILLINGSPRKENGFSAQALNLVGEHLAQQNIETGRINLADANIQDCTGCFVCLKTGVCPIQDDMPEIIRQMLEADGYVVASSVRNELVTACYKRFYERITYPLGFPRLLDDKHTMAISSVGGFGGRSVNRRLLGLQDVCHTHLSSHLHAGVGIPQKRSPADYAPRLRRAADKLLQDIRAARSRSMPDRFFDWINRAIMIHFMFDKAPDNFANVIAAWKRKDYMK